MQIDKHWLLNINKVTTENFDQRPIEEDISLIVIHCISLPPGQFGNDFIDQLFCNQLTPQQHPYFEEIYQLKVSAHILIKRSGEITQYVAFNQRAWHAGFSEYKGRNACNDFSIGIELEGLETKQYTEQQYMQLSALISLLVNYYPKLSVDNIVGHSDIAQGRKTDPGESFDWQKLNSALASI
ncbi:MAG: 1,6-anhydro-N-acetylmuramyl-L-alanine amidase AmpD [Methylococcales symbiont of Hymedesmia sp. n. MRB-2018]|nr:MAG: 1,6-anhydro-N-acetylmuramyl-L-alanine amidase AmpD [Methylococcales symbiont of Hymedesmia sp. n. MRB-2018]KAF3983659.1 MAG: 1,6-anhydro-N-acetylmuramyl-L-alanine amidase AmpD [Methylococcales symbiont of Hymedesmia sp. n. MRB-2018]